MASTTQDDGVVWLTPGLRALEESGAWRRATLTVLALATVVAAGLRLWRLGALGLVVDEGFMALAVQGILRRGVPVLEHGEVYGRSLLFLYMQAGCSWLVGEGAWGLRLPAALWGVAMVPLSYWLTRRLLGSAVAVAVAVLVALSAWHVEMSRYARFYTLFGSLWLLAVGWFYGGFVRGRRVEQVGYAVVVLVGFTVHELMILAGTLPLVLLPLRGYSWRVRLTGAAVTVACVPLKKVLLMGYNGIVGAIQARWPVTPVVPVTYQGVASPREEQVVPLVLPDWEPLRQMAHGSPGVLAAVVAAAAVAVVLILVGLRRSENGAGEEAQPQAGGGGGAPGATGGGARVAGATGGGECAIPAGVRAGVLAALVATAAVGQLGLATVALVVYLLFIARSWRGLLQLATTAAAASVAVSVVVWVGWSMDQMHLPWRRVLPELFSSPELGGYFLRWMLAGWPWLTAVLPVGLALLLTRTWRSEKCNGAAMALGAFLVPLLAAAALQSKFEEARYFYHLYVATQMVYAVAVVTVVAWGVERAWGIRALRKRPGLVVAVAAALTLVGAVVVSQDSAPWSAARVTLRQYGQPKDKIKSAVSWPLHAGFHQDWATTTAYVREHRRPGDTVLVVGPPHLAAIYRYYLGRVDYVFGDPEAYIRMMRDEHGWLYDDVADALVVDDLDKLRSVVERPRAGVLWVLTDRALQQPEQWVVRDAAKTYFLDLAKAPVCLGKDQGQDARGWRWGSMVLRLGEPDRGDGG